jgi:3D (Asp-Asp-Asp) domain-containing protein
LTAQCSSIYQKRVLGQEIELISEVSNEKTCQNPKSINNAPVKRQVASTSCLFLCLAGNGSTFNRRCKVSKLNCFSEANHLAYLQDWMREMAHLECDRIARQKKIRNVTLAAIGLILLLVLAFAGCRKEAFASETWKITAYCPCSQCCGKSNGITASGKKAHYGYVACNWLPFGSKVRIAGLGEFIVMDRGAKSQFGSKNNHIKHLDIFMNSHKEALNFGLQYREVSI